MSNNTQHFIIIEPNTDAVTMEIQIKKWLDEGWRITSVTPQHVSSGSSYGHTSGGYLILIENYFYQNNLKILNFYYFVVLYH